VCNHGVDHGLKYWEHHVSGFTLVRHGGMTALEGVPICAFSADSLLLSWPVMVQGLFAAPKSRALRMP